MSTLMPTAESFLKDFILKKYNNFNRGDITESQREDALATLISVFNFSIFKKTIEDAMIEFGRLHVLASLQAAYANAELDTVPYTSDYTINKESILSAYPIEKIV